MPFFGGVDVSIFNAFAVGMVPDGRYTTPNATRAGGTANASDNIINAFPLIMLRSRIISAIGAVKVSTTDVAGSIQCAIYANIANESYPGARLFLSGDIPIDAAAKFYGDTAISWPLDAGLLWAAIYMKGAQGALVWRASTPGEDTPTLGFADPPPTSLGNAVAYQLTGQVDLPNPFTAGATLLTGTSIVPFLRVED